MTAEPFPEPSHHHCATPAKTLALGSGFLASPPDPNRVSRPSPVADRRVADASLLLYADTLDDFERARIALENRLRSLVDPGAKGVSRHLPEVTVIEGLLAHHRANEHGAELALKRAMRAHPLGPWVARTVGVGEKQAARLLAAIGDPAERPNLGKLWAYCGLHVLVPGHRPSETHSTSAGDEDPSQAEGHKGDDGQPQLAPGLAPRRSRGQRANWSTRAKTRCYLVAASCIKHRHSPYRLVYDFGRLKYTDAVHHHPCSQCGPPGKPALSGSQLSLGHQHARAMRLVMKEILRDLWLESRCLAQRTPDIHCWLGGVSDSQAEEL